MFGIIYFGFFVFVVFLLNVMFGFDMVYIVGCSVV